ncbi:MAG: hypothetical protein ACYTGL_08335 [Planctomycetota bacterium]
MPRSRQRPVRCARCADNSRDDDSGEIEFKSLSESAERTASVAPLPVAHSTEKSEKPSAVAGPGGAEVQRQLDQVLAHLDGISRTMKLFRRFIWAIGIAMLLNVVVVAACVIYGISMLGSLTGALSGSGGAGAHGNGQEAINALPEQFRRDFQAVEDYSNTLNELLEEAR